MSLLAQAIVVEQLSLLFGVRSGDLDHDTFPSLGGHSLSAVRLSSLCKKKGVKLTVGTILRSKSISDMMQSAELLLDTEIFQVHKHAAETLDSTCSWLDRVDAAGIDFRMDSDSRLCETFTEAAAGVVPASEMQLSLIHGTVKRPGTNIIQHFESYRHDQVPLIKAAWRRVFEQESILMTRYSSDLLPQKVTTFDWTEASTDNPVQFDEWLQQPPSPELVGCAWKVFSLTATEGNGVIPRSVIVWNIHHALIDGFSAELVLNKVRKAAAGKDTMPGPSFTDFSRQLQLLRERRKGEGDRFWAQNQELHGRAATALQLPKPLEPEAAYGEHVVDTGVSLEALDRMARQCKVTQATLFHAAWAVVTSFLAESDEVAFGMVLSGRNLPLPGCEEVVGPLVNTLPLAVSLRSGGTLGDLAVDVFQRMVELAEYQWTTPENGYSRSFQTALAMQFDLEALNDDEGSVVRPIDRPYSKQHTDIPLSVAIDRETIHLQYFKTDLRDCDVELVGRLYRQALADFASPDMTVAESQARMMPDGVKETVLRYGNCFADSTFESSYASNDLVTLFERTAQLHPDVPAVENGGSQMMYRELDEAANAVAAELRKHVSPGDVVCVDADRSIGWIVAIFGILKAGAVYCALDTALPAQLRASMFDWAGAKVFVCPRASGAARAPANAHQSPVVELILAAETGPEQRRLDAPRRAATPAAAAYVCFTSGSTGQPKGVVCTHQGLAAFQKDLEVRLFAQPGVRVSQLMSVAFDGSIHEIFSALCHGATLVLPQAADNPFETLMTVHSAILTPSVADVLDPDEFASLKHVYLVGEPVKQATADRWGASKALYNMYGPTEGTGGATIKRLRPGQAVTIGRPNPSTRVYIVSARGDLVPPGVIGEICLAGVQIARGYLGMPEATAQRFVRDERRGGGGERMYKTGDRGYWTGDGEIVCLGRTDRQIKLRGFRLDLDDLEVRVARAVPGARAVAIARQDDHLVAAIQPASLDAAAVAAHMADALPAYARPRRVMLVDRFPMTRAGKRDYKQMVAGDFGDAGALQREGLVPRTPTEATVAAVWRQLLPLQRSEPVGPASSFVQLGGNSLLQMKMRARLSSVLQLRVPLKLVVENATLGALAAALARLAEADGGKPGGARPLGPRRLSPIEHDWWLKYRLGGPATAFTVSFVGRLAPGRVDRAALAAAWDAVLARHAIFASRYVPKSARRGGVERQYAPHAPRVQRVRQADVWAEVNRPFDLAAGPPVRVVLAPDALVVTMSHIVADLTTLGIVLREVAAAYAGRALPPVGCTYEEGVLWPEAAPPCDLSFWTAYLEDYCPPAAAAAAAAVTERRSYRGTSAVFALRSGLAAGMLAFAPAHGLSLQQLAIAAVALALPGHRADDGTDVVLGTPFINRSTDADLETVGLFLEPLPVRVRHRPGPLDADATPYLDHVRDSAKAALAHAVPWHQLLAQLALDRNYPGSPLFDVMVTVHEPSSAAVTLDVAGFTPCFTWAEGSKFPLMAEFTVLGTGSIVLRLEYDTELYGGRAAAAAVAASIAHALSLLVVGVPCADIKRELRQGCSEPDALLVERPEVFGLPLRDI